MLQIKNVAQTCHSLSCVTLLAVGNDTVVRGFVGGWIFYMVTTNGIVISFSIADNQRSTTAAWSTTWRLPEI